MEKQKLFKRESKNLYSGVNWIAGRKYGKREELDERTKGNARWSSLRPLIDVIDIIVEGREQDTQNRISIRLKTVPVSFSFARGQLKLIYLYRLAGKFLRSVPPRRWERTASYKIELTIVAILLGGSGVCIVTMSCQAKRNFIENCGVLGPRPVQVDILERTGNGSQFLRLTNETMENLTTM